MGNNLVDLKHSLRDFAAERDWEQFHSPKNLAMALVGEAAEILEHFQWLTEKQSYAIMKTKRPEIEEELADVFIYLIRLADKLNVDLVAAATDKIRQNQAKYPAEKVRGSAKKYTEYPEEVNKE